MESVREIRAEHDRLLDLAVVKPTPANVLAYHQFKTKMLAQSETFSAVSQSVIWANPEIDYNATNPVANFAQTSQRIRQGISERKTTTTHPDGTVREEYAYLALHIPEKV